MKGTVKVGSKTFPCSFTLVYTGLKLDLKKSKAQCSPKLKRNVKIPNYTISGTEMVFTFTITITKKGKTITLSKAKIVQTTPPTPAPAPPSTPSTAPAPSTKPPTMPG